MCAVAACLGVSSGSAFELARRTGSQVVVLGAFEPSADIGDSMQPMLRDDVHLLLQARLGLAGGISVRAPVDETIEQGILSIGMVEKGVIFVRRPDGTVVHPTDPGIIITETAGGRVVTVNAPQVGDWSIDILGRGATLVTVAGATSTYLYKFEFVNMAGRTAHQGLFPIDGSPIVGKTQTMRAVFFGSAAISEFSFRRPDGTVISRFTMAKGSRTNDLVGEVVPPLGQFLVYVRGITAGGKSFQRVLPGQQKASYVEVRAASDLTAVPVGRTSAVAFSITNHGVPATYQLTVTDSKGFLSPVALAPVSLATDETRVVTVNVTPPASAQPLTEFALTLTASAGTDDTSNSASVVLSVESSNSDPLCAAASASPNIIRVRNRKMVPISIVGVTDADNDPVQIRIEAISQDEPLTGDGSGSTPFDASGIGLSMAQVRAERSGTGDGRVYRIAFEATDGKGGSCSGSVKVEVPHDNRTSAPDNGSAFDSTGIN